MERFKTAFLVRVIMYDITPMRTKLAKSRAMFLPREKFLKAGLFGFRYCG